MYHNNHGFFSKYVVAYFDIIQLNGIAHYPLINSGPLEKIFF